MLVKCTRDDVGWWTVGEVYQAHAEASGSICVGDDDEPDQNVEGWIAWPIAYEDDANNTATYALAGLDGVVEFKEVAPS